MPEGSALIPLIGLGTGQLRGRICVDTVAQALRLGYRHIDTAEGYENERDVGEGLHASGVHREDIFVTTKISPSHFAPRELERAAKDSLMRLRLSEIDLLLLHWPNPQVPLSATLEALCKVKRAGLTRHIGVSNFQVADLDEAVRHASEPLVCNQIEMNSFVDRPKLTAACRAHHMAAFITGLVIAAASLFG
jgi:2,5-diketo-D-gluconate reductase B